MKVKTSNNSKHHIQKRNQDTTYRRHEHRKKVDKGFRVKSPVNRDDYGWNKEEVAERE